jgi:V/A-type H+-transporting ATPase subunit D
VSGREQGRGRAARLRLLGRLHTAQHASDLLHSKEQALQRERARLEGHAERSRRDWEAECGEAASWLTLALALGAGAELHDLVQRAEPSATVTAHWATSMGLTYPGSVECTPGGPPQVRSTAAIRPTVGAYRRAMTIGATHAAATMALRRLDHELATTRRRRRAIGERLVPRLEHQIHELELGLDEQDREEALRVDLARRARGDDRR